MKTQPGECHDKRGVPIYPGDLLKTFAFTGSRRKKYWLYHIAVFNKRYGTMQIVPVSELEPTKRGQGGCAWLTIEQAADAEVIYGHGPGDCLDFSERPRRRAT